MTPRHGAFLAVTIGFMFLASAASGQQPRAPQAEAQPARPLDGQGLDADTAVDVSEEVLARLQAGDGRLQARLKADFQNGPEWKAAIEAVKRTTKDYEAARKAALSKLQTTTDYAQAAAQYQKARQEYDALTDRPADEARREQLAKQVLAAHAAMSKLEAAAMKADPDVQRTRPAMLKAQTDLAALKKVAANAYENHPEWLAHQKKVEDAQSALAGARQAQQQQAYAAQARAEQEAHDRLRDQALLQLQQEVLRQQIILSIQQQQLAAQAQWIRPPQVTTLGEGGIVGSPFIRVDNCVPYRTGSRYWPGGSGTRPVYR
jgi:hypothetical protein